MRNATGASGQGRIRALAASVFGAMLLGTTVFLMWAGSDIIGRLGSHPRDNTTWLVSQLEIELHRLRAALSDMEAGVGQRAEVRLRVDLLASRVLLLDAPAVTDVLDADTMARSRSKAVALVNHADRLLAGDSNGWRPLIDRIDRVRSEFHDLALHAVEVVATQNARDAAVLARIDAASKVAAMTVAILLLGGSGWLFRQHRVLEQMTVDLRRAAQAATEASRAKSEFLASMSHELRTPLNAIIGFADLMRHAIWGALGHPRYNEYAEHIGHSGEHLLSLVNDILDLAKVEAGRFELAVQPLDVGEQVVEAIAMVTPQADTRNVALEMHVADDLPRLQADERRLRQILVNLIYNGIKFADGQPVTVSAVAQGGGIRLAVTDRGAGMTAEQVAIAMEPFGQISDQADHAKEGTGLGLPLTKALVEAHGGTFSVDSDLGRGTTVTVALPVWRSLPSGTVRKADHETEVGFRASAAPATSRG